jgi:hypothetical protein
MTPETASVINKPIPAEVAAAVCAHFKRNLDFTFAGWPHGQSMTWRATDGRGPAVYVKVHAEPYLYQRHTRAYERWVPHLPCPTPEMLLSEESLLLMVFAELPGVPLENASLPLELELEAYETAGRVARVFHELPASPEEQPGDPGESAAQRMRDMIEAADGLLSNETLKWAESVGTDARAFAGEQFVPCHRDYSPRNWLVEAQDGRLEWSLIDFERARHDFRYVDFQRMWPDHWRERPNRREAFFRGYGRELTLDEEHRLKLTFLRTCVGTVPWARDNGDPPFEAWARENLERLRREW